MAAPSKSMVGVHVKTEGDRGFLDLHFQVNGKPIAQTFELAGSVMRVGGVRWTVKCPESGKMVRDLYLVLRPDHTHFRSRHALGLSYRTSYLSRKNVMGNVPGGLWIGLARQWGEPPIRPKYMQRRTFRRLDGRTWGRHELRAFVCEPRSETRCRYRPPPKAPQVVESMNVIAGDPHLIVLYPRATCAKAQAAHRRGPRLLANRRLRQFRCGAVERMTGNHPRNTGPMLPSLRCGAKTPSGKPCGSPAVARKALPNAWWCAGIRGSPRQQERAEARPLYARSHRGTPATAAADAAIAHADSRHRVIDLEPPCRVLGERAVECAVLPLSAQPVRGRCTRGPSAMPRSTARRCA